MTGPFLTLNGKVYAVGDWLADKRVLDAKVPTVIADVFEDETGMVVILRDPSLQYEVVKLADFITLINDGIITKMEKPLYLIGQRFKNNFTEDFLLILSISPAKSYETGEYHYFVTEYRSRFGDNYKTLKESEITQYFATEGVESSL